MRSSASSDRTDDSDLMNLSLTRNNFEDVNENDENEISEYRVSKEDITSAIHFATAQLYCQVLLTVNYHNLELNLGARSILE